MKLGKIVKALTVQRDNLKIIKAEAETESTTWHFLLLAIDELDCAITILSNLAERGE